MLEHLGQTRKIVDDIKKLLQSDEKAKDIAILFRVNALSRSLEDNYQFRKGQLGSSCMRYKKCQGYLDIYVDNPESCNLLIMYSDLNKSKISGRAIIWKVSDKLTIMDRIYTINDYDIQVFKKYAEEKGWETVDKIRSTVKIPLKKSNFSQYPYVDNFFILNYIEGYLTDEEERWPEEGFYKLQNTDGGYRSDDGVWSEYHGTYLNREDAVWCIALS